MSLGTMSAAFTDWLRRGVSRLDRPSEREFLPAALEVLESPASPTSRFLGMTIIGFFVLAFVWALFGRVDVIADAPGRLLPAGRTKVIQPLDPGVVRVIRVQDGDHVVAGQVLVELDSTEAAADRERLERDLMQARLDVARLEALKPTVERGAAAAPLIAPPGASADDIALAQAALRAQIAGQAAKVGNLDQQIAEKQAETGEVAAAIDKLKTSLPLLQYKEQLHHKLYQQGYGTSFADIDAQQAVSEARNDIAVDRERETETRAAGAALRRQREETVSEYDAGVLADLAKAQSRVNELAQDLIKAQQKSAETQLRAPVPGVVQDLAVHTVGGVVTPAERLMSVAPDSRGLTVEARLANRDIGFVHAGQDAAVKVETYAFTRYGLIHGKVIDVSRDVSALPERTDTDREAPATPPTYVAHIALDRATMIVDGQSRPLLPGMSVTAEIKTGRRTIIDYLLSPLARRGSEAMHER